MKPRFHLREWLLLLPVLVFVGGAFYWRRVEKVSALNGSEMFIEKVELKTALGRSRESGSSHVLMVTIDHPWPKPRFWNHCCNISGGLNSLKKPLKIESLIRGSKPEDYIAAQGELIWNHEGKSEVLKRDGRPLVYGDGGFKDGKYVFGHSLALQNVGPQGEIVFHGAYIVAGRPALEIRRVIRKKGEVLAFDSSRNTGGTIVSITPQQWISPSNVKRNYADVVFHIRRPEMPADGKRRGALIYACELVDGKGRVYEAYTGNDSFIVAWGDGDNENLPLNEVNSRVVPTLNGNFNPPGPLTLRGKVSIDDNWPIPFSIKLLPR